jgi:hypothetical protein
MAKSSNSAISLAASLAVIFAIVWVSGKAWKKSGA